MARSVRRREGDRAHRGGRADLRAVLVGAEARPPAALARVGLRHAAARARDAAHDGGGRAVRHPRSWASRSARRCCWARCSRPTDPVLAGDIGVGPPGDEAEHEPNFALTAEAGGNDGLAAPLVLIGDLRGRGGRHAAGSASGSWPTSSTPARPAWRSAPPSAGRRRGASTGCATASCSRPASTATTRSRPRSCSTAPPRPPAATASSPSSSGGLAFRRYEHDHELNGRVHRGRRAGREVHGARGDPAARLAAHRRRADRAGLGGLAARGRAARGHPPAERRSSRSSARRSRRRAAGRSSRWFGVRGVGTLYYAATVVAAGVLSGGEEQLVRVDRDRLRDRLDRRPRRHGRARAAAAVPHLREEERQAAPDVRPRSAPAPATPPAR